MKDKNLKKISEKNMLIEKIMSFYCIAMGLLIVLIDTIIRVIKTFVKGIAHLIIGVIRKIYMVFKEASEKRRLSKKDLKEQESAEEASEEIFSKIAENQGILEEIIEEEIKKTPEIAITEEELEIEKAPKKHKHLKIPIFLKKKAAFAYLTIAFFVICGGIYALLSDKAVAEPDIQAGTVLVKLEEDAPFNNLGAISEEGAETDEKTFRAISICTIDTYVRARIIPVIEKYDSEEECYVVIPIDINDVNLNVYAPDWTYSNGYYYYNYILEAGTTSEDINVTVTSIGGDEDFQDIDVRVTLRVELEASQIRNDLWKQIFNIETLPF